VTAVLPGSTRLAASQCAHCGLEVPLGGCDPLADHQFCCSGCRAAWELIHAAGLEAYYHGEDRRALPVVASGRRYQEFDHQAFHALYVRDLPGGLRETELYLDQVHCASCVWLVERVPLAVPGAISAELQVARSLVRLRWDPAQTTLSRIAWFLDSLGYPAHPFRGGRAEERRRAEDRAMLVRIGVAGAIAVNVMTAALALYAGWFGAMEAEYVRYFRWLSLGLTLPAVLWPGRVFFTSAWGALRARRLHMDLPIALALGAGTIRGAVNTLTDSGPIYFDGVVTLIFLLLVGRYLQQRAQRAAADSAELLHSLTPATARVVEAEGIREVPVEALTPGATIQVRAGDTLASDGVVVSGESTIDLSLLTGESDPRAVRVGGRVFAGTINLTSPIEVEVTEAGEASRLGRILRELEAGLGRRAPVVHTADRVAGWFVAAVLVLAASTYVWWEGRDPTVALDHAIALLIVTCPCALALATPLAMTVAIGRAARSGILIRGADALGMLSRPSTLLLDKTGTLTEGRLDLLHWAGAAGADADRWRAAVKGIESHSNHPIARALVAAWPEVPPAAVTDVKQTLGQGIEGRVGSDRVVIGSPPFVRSRGLDPAGWSATVPVHLTPVLVAVNGLVVAAAGLGDPLRPDSAAAIAALRDRGWRVGILSGDAPTVVAAIGRALGIAEPEARGGVSPEEKLARVERALRDGPAVMVGDGVNDAPAIGRATVGIGVRGGAEACLAAADVFLTRAGLGALVELVDGAAGTLRLIRRNVAISIGYNLIGAALAVTGVINPLIAAVMMPASSLTVVLLSWRGRTFGARR
jgi:Cu2+-exporting ATPase